MHFVGMDVGLLQPKYGNCACQPHLPYESGPHRSTEFFMAIYPGPQFAQETVTQKFADYPDQLLRAAALSTVNRDSTVRPFKESYEPWNEVG